MVLLAMPAALADVESDHLENYANQKWWVGKGLDVGDIFIYKICDPDTFSGLYDGPPWGERCYYVSLHFVTLLLGDSGPEWIVQVMIINDFGDRLYDVYNIDGKTLQIIGMTDERKVAWAVQNTVFGLTEFTNRESQALIVGEQWGTVKSVASPEIKFIVRDVVIDENDREVFLAGYTTTATSIHRITINEPFPLSAEVYNSHRLLPAADRIYDYDLILSGNSFLDGFDSDGWFDKLDSLDVGVFLEFPSPAPDPGAGIVNFCGITQPEAGSADDVIDTGGYVEYVENVVDDPGLPDQEFVDLVEFVDEFETEDTVEPLVDEIAVETAGVVQFEDVTIDEIIYDVSGMPAVDYCVDLLASEGLAVVPAVEPEFEFEVEVTGLQENVTPDDFQEEDLFADFPEDDFPPNGVTTPGTVQPGVVIPEPIEDDAGMVETLPDGTIPPEDPFPEDEISANTTQTDDIILTEPVLADEAVPEEAQVPAEETPSTETVVEIIPAEPAPAEDDMFAGIVDGITDFFGGIVGFFGTIGDMFGDLMGSFVVTSPVADILDILPEAHAQSDAFDDAYQKLLGSIKGNNTEAEQIGFAQLLKLIVQEETEDDSITAEGNFVWIPTKMIEGLEYEGIVLLDSATRTHRTVILASSDLDILTVEQEVTVQAGRNSAIFGISAEAGGTAQVYAAMGGEALATDESTVYEINTEPHQILMITPNAGPSGIQDTVVEVQDVNFPSTDEQQDGTVAGSSGTVVNTGTVPVFIYMLDQNGAPASADTDTVLHIGASAGMTVPETVIIPTGDTHVKLVAGIDRSGTIHATSPGLLPYTVGIDRVVDEIDVGFAIVPTVVAEGSTAHYYVWLEKNGQPYKPNHVIDVQFTSSDRNVANFRPAYMDVGETLAREKAANCADGRYPRCNNSADVSVPRDNVMTIQMVDGFARGVIHAGERGPVTLTASVPQYGTAFYGIHVGATSISDTALCAEEDDEDGPVIKRSNPTDMLVWLMPAVTDSVAYAVVAQYYMINVDDEPDPLEETTVPRDSAVPGDTLVPDVLSSVDQQALDLFGSLVSLSQGGFGDSSGEDGCVAFPVPFSEQFIMVSSDGGAIHDGIYDTLHRHGMMDTVIEFPIEFLTTGEHTVQVIGNEIGEFEETEDLFGSWTDGFAWEATVLVDDAYVEDYSLGITTLPFDSDGLHEVAVVHLQDGDGNMVDSNSLPLRTHDLVISQASEDFEISRYGNTFVLSASLNKTDGVAVSTASLAPVSRQIVPADEIVGTYIDVPERVHSGEEFPYVIHEVTSDGVPLKKIGEPDVSLGDGVVQSSDGRLITEDDDVTGTITVLGVGEPITETIDVNKNELDFEIELDSDDARVGEPVILRLISDIANIDYTIEWPAWLDYEETGEDEYVITPNREYNGTINVSGEKKGYGTERESVSLVAIHEVDFDVRAEAGGRVVAIKPDITNVEDESAVEVPYVGPPLFVHVKYPIEHVSPIGEGYLFMEVEINGNSIGLSEIELHVDKDVRIVGYYERQVFIDIVDAEGGGVYRIGEDVHVYAPDEEKFLFFITEVFSHWEGDLAGRGPGPFVMTAENDLYSKAVYVEDHMVWMGIVFAAVAAVAVLSIFRKSDRLKWMFGSMSGLGKIKPKRKKKKIVKESDFAGEPDDVS